MIQSKFDKINDVIKKKIKSIGPQKRNRVDKNVKVDDKKNNDTKIVDYEVNDNKNINNTEIVDYDKKNDNNMEIVDGDKKNNNSTEIVDGDNDNSTFNIYDDGVKVVDDDNANSKDTNSKVTNDNDKKSILGKERITKENKIVMEYDKVHHVYLPPNGNFCIKDFERLARSLLGKKIGLVLGGGGARGLAHIGVIQALEESDIPIDIVGGTSMGAYIGALYARKCDNTSVYREAKIFAKNMGSKWRHLLDLTYPFCSMFTGHAFNRLIFSSFKDTKIENLWIEYFCITTNITTFEEVMHRKGFLWKYVRASMSLSGYLPPICDYKDGVVNLLLDGGYMNNVPAFAMLDLDVDKIIAVDVGSTVINDHYNYGDSLNGFYILFQKFFGTKKFLSMDEIQYRLAYVSSEKKMKEMQNSNILLLRPEIDDYKTMDFAKFEEIVACGYSYGKKIIKEWKENGTINELIPMQNKHKRRFSI